MKSKITNEDCMELMARYPDNYFDLAIVDPPYGIGEKRQATNKSRGIALPRPIDYKPFAGGDIEPPNLQYFEALRRVSKNQIIWGANHFMQNLQLGSSILLDCLG